MRKLQTIIGAGVLALASVAAHADTAWNFTYSGNGVSASGSFTTLGDGSTPSAVTSVTGTYSDAQVLHGTIDGVVALGTDGGFYYDNLFGGSPLFSNSGLLFDVDGGVHVNLYTVGNDYRSVKWLEGNVVDTSVSLKVSAVPEPGPVTMLLAGIGALGFASRRKMRR